MAFWIEERKNIFDPERPGKSGVIVKYGCDTPADISLLPGPSPKLTGSSVFVISPAEVWKLGSAGWIKVG